MTDTRTAFADTASALLDEDPLTAVVLAEISADMFGKAAARHPDRVLNLGIREQLGRARRAGQHRGILRRGFVGADAPGA